VVEESEVFEVIRRDLVGVVEEELRRLDTSFEFRCRDARVWEDQIYFGFNVDYPFGDLPATRTFYARKTDVEEISMRVEVLTAEGVSYHIATIWFYFVKGICYKHYVVHSARLNDLAHAIIEISKAEAEEA
jgi:hypothetical protein